MVEVPRDSGLPQWRCYFLLDDRPGHAAQAIPGSPGAAALRRRGASSNQRGGFRRTVRYGTGAAPSLPRGHRPTARPTSRRAAWKLSAPSKTGKQVVVALARPTSRRGLPGREPLRMGTANAVMRMPLSAHLKRDMVQMLHDYPESRPIPGAHADAQHLQSRRTWWISSSIQREAARTYAAPPRPIRKEETTQRVLPASQMTLAEMVGHAALARGLFTTSSANSGVDRIQRRAQGGTALC